ncbi:MAG: TonB-dependent receptor [candidate division KSB1 bacterium]|jgi:hypothetical protein|nr:TonB-dependent receptor [candidate division KSB1 bacterium]
MDPKTNIVLALIFSIIFLSSIFSPCSAQVTTADIEGRITGEENHGLGNVDVIALNQETGIIRGAASSRNGRYRIAALQPGIYEISARHIGYAVQIRHDIVLSVGQVARFDFQLVPRVLAASDTLMVSAKAPLIEITESDVGLVVQDSEIESLPLSSRNVVNLALLSPGVTHEVNQPYSPLNFGANNCRSARVFLDGIDFSAKMTGGIMGQISQNAVEQFEVITSRFKAEYGNTASGIINLVTKSGTNEYHGDIFTLFSDDALNESNYFSDEKAQYDRQQFGFTFGGPVIPDRTHFFVAYERSNENKYPVVNTNGVLPEEEGTIRAPVITTNYFVRLDHQLSSNQWLMANVNYYKEDEANAFVGGVRTKSIGSDFITKLYTGSISHKWVISNRLLNEIRCGYVNSNIDLYPTSNEPNLIYPSCVTGGTTGGRQIVDELSFHIRDDLSFHVPDLWGEHDLKIGLHIQRMKLHQSVGPFPNGRFIFPTDTSTLPVIALIGDGIRDHGNYYNTRFSFYLQDDWSPMENLTFNVGVRYSIATNETNQDYVSGMDDPDLPYIVKADRPVDKDNIAPRLGFALDPLNNGSTVVRGGYGIFYGQIIADIPYSEIRIDDYRIYNVYNPGTTNKADIDLSGLPYQVDGLLPQNVSIPYNEHFSIGLSRQLTDDFAIDIDYIGSRGHNYIFIHRDINLIDPETLNRSLPQYKEVFVGRNDGRTYYDALQIVLRKRFSGSYQFRASYTLANAENDFDDWYFVAPGSFLRGPASWDERHRFQFNGQVMLPFGVQLSGIMTLTSGRPYNVNTGTDANRNGDLRDDYQPGKGRNLERADGYSNIDLRMSKFIDFGKYRLELIAETFNLLNQVNYDASSYIGNPNSPAYGEPTVALPPRQIQFGTRISF